MRVTKKHFQFFMINLISVILLISALFWINNGSLKNEYPYDLLAISTLVAVPIIFFQYPLLNFKRNWLYKSIVFYLSMVAFLFVLGMITAWNQMVGDNEAGTWLARLDAGLRMSIYGQIFGGIVGFGTIILINLSLKEKLF